MKVAIIDKYKTRVNYSDYIDHELDVYHLVNTQQKKVLKKDITLDLGVVDDYDIVITVGAEATKFVAKITSVTNYQGVLVDKKFIPLSNPAMLAFKPEAKPAFSKAIENISKILNGEDLQIDYASLEIEGIESTGRALEVLKELSSSKYTTISVDTETTALYPRDGYVMGISLSWKKEQGIYISTDCINEECEYLLQEIFDKKVVVFHNAKFDIAMLSYHFGFKFPEWEDTLLMHYCLEENPGTHGLKQLAMKYTKLGDYDADLEAYKREYCKLKKIKLGDFTYDLIPFDIMYKYAALDTAATIELYSFLKGHLEKDGSIEYVYNNILKPGTRFLLKVEDNGVPFSKDFLLNAEQELSKEITNLELELYSHPAVKEYESLTDNTLNPGSTQQLRILLFKILKLTPLKTTATGEFSTDAETLEALSKESDVAELVLKVRKLKKIKSTYIDKILIGIDPDNRLRTGFNLASTTSGRLSSSGKLNLQQLPRDNKIVKKCISAREGYKLVAMDLATAEMYVAAVLSGDKKLQRVFSSGGDFHSSIAKQVFNLPCAVEEVKSLYGTERQSAKAVSFGIMYGSGAASVADSAGISIEEAKEVISTYFKTFGKLKSWLKEQQDIIRQTGVIYSIFGRKRRLKNYTSSDNSVVSHEIRSGVNFLVQSVASDINLLAGIDLQNYLNNNLAIDAKIIMLVHDSIVAEVREEDIDIYVSKLKYYVQKDMCASIKDCPVGVDIDIGDNYAFVEEE